MPAQPDLTALIGSRICHDLISPLGAIGNGVELLLMEKAAAGPEMALISESVANASARIRFFRVAFGFANADQRIGRPEICSILADLTRGSRLTIDWLPPGDQPRHEVRLAFLAIQCLENAMPWGGNIAVDRDGPRWTVTGAARRLRLDGAPWPLLTGADPETLPEVTPAQVQFALIPPELARMGRRLTLDTAADRIALAF